MVLLLLLQVEEFRSTLIGFSSRWNELKPKSGPQGESLQANQAPRLQSKKGRNSQIGAVQVLFQ